MQGSERSRGDPGALGFFCGGPSRLGGGMLSPRARGPSVPTGIPPSGPGIREQHSAARWSPEALTLTPTLTPTGATPRQMCT